MLDPEIFVECLIHGCILKYLAQVRHLIISKTKTQQTYLISATGVPSFT